MFRREDYWPYMFGIFVFAGLVAVPLIWGQFIELPYGRLVAGSLVGCFVFAYAHTREGQFSFGRFIVGFGFVLLMSLRITAKSGGIGAFVPGGLLGFVVMGAGGWLGIGIARILGISEALVTPDPTVLSTHDESNAPSGVDETPASSTQQSTEYSFAEQDRRDLFERTQEAWQAGNLSHVSDHFAKVAAGMSYEEFSKLFKPALNAIAFAFLRSPPQEDEYLLCAEDAQVRLSFVLTNRYFYFFGLDQGVLANKYESGKIALENIRECTLNEGWVFNKATVALRSGKTLDLKDLMSPDPVKYIMKMAEGAGSAS